MDSREPLGLPRGSVRAILTLSLVWAVIAAVFAGVSDARLSLLAGMAGTATGYYFGHKAVKE